MRLWIAMTLAAIGLMAGAWWLTMPRATETAAVDPNRETGSGSKGNQFGLAPTYIPPVPPKFLPRDLAELAEPISVVPESSEVAAEPSPFASEAPNVASATPVALHRIVPRPEAGTEPTPFMPYADEASELARLLRPEDNRLTGAADHGAAAHSPVAGFRGDR